MTTQIYSQNISDVEAVLSNEKVATVDYKEVHGLEKTHVLYSRGHLLDGANYFEALNNIAKLSRRTTKQVEERLLIGKRKKIISSYYLKDVIALEAKFTKLGLDVYIESDSL